MREAVGLALLEREGRFGGIDEAGAVRVPEELGGHADGGGARRPAFGASGHEIQAPVLVGVEHGERGIRVTKLEVVVSRAVETSCRVASVNCQLPSLRYSLGSTGDEVTLSRSRSVVAVDVDEGSAGLQSAERGRQRQLAGAVIQQDALRHEDVRIVVVVEVFDRQERADALGPEARYFREGSGAVVAQPDELGREPSHADDVLMAVPVDVGNRGPVWGCR